MSSNVSSALLARLVRAKGVVRLDNRTATAARLAERASPAMLASLRLPDGGIYAFPWKTNPEMLMYNVGLLKAAGVAPPRTHSELLNAFRKLARDTDGDGRLDRWGMWAPLKTTWYERFYDFYPLYLASSGGKTLVERGRWCSTTLPPLPLSRCCGGVLRRVRCPTRTLPWAAIRSPMERSP